MAALAGRPYVSDGLPSEERSMTPHCLSWSDMPESVSETGLRRRRIDGAGVGLMWTVVPAGTKGAWHSHPHEQFVQVISGSGTLETEQGRVPFGPGSVFHFPPDTRHAAEFDTETVLVDVNLPA